MIEQNGKMLNVSYSTVIKGIAITLMIFHHGLGLPAEWFEDGLGYGQILLGTHKLYEMLGNPLKLCVSLFAFLTGYSYCLRKEYTFSYGMKKSLSLLMKYWGVLFLLFYPLGFIISGHIPGIKELIFNIIPIHQRAVSFSWYVLFYILCMCSLPFIICLVSHRKIVDFCAIPLTCTIILNILDKIVIQRWYLLDVVKDYFYWMPIVWTGYVFAYYRVLEKIMCKMNIWLSWCMVICVPILRGMCSEVYRLNVDVIYAPLYVCAIIWLIKENSMFYKMWMFLGKYSMYIWLLHALFFWEKTRRVFQPIVYCNQHIMISMGLLLILSLIMAIIVDKFVRIIKC